MVHSHEGNHHYRLGRSSTRHPSIHRYDTMSIEKAYMHTEDAYKRVGDILDKMSSMQVERAPLEEVQLDLFRTLQELALLHDDGK